MADALQVEYLIAGVIDAAGDPLESGTVSFFETDGVTIKTIWEDANKVTPSANPVTLTSRGTAKVFADGVYSFTIKDSAGSTIDTREFTTYDPEASPSVLGIDASQFGSGDDADAISQAISSAGGNPANVYLKDIGLSGWNLDANLTIPTNINFQPFYGAFTDIQAGITLTVSGTISAPLFNIFRGAGTVIIDDRNNDIPSIWLIGGVHDNRTLDGVVTFPDTLKGSAGILTVDDSLTVNVSGKFGNSALEDALSVGRDNDAGDSTNTVKLNTGNFNSDQGNISVQYVNAAAAASPQGIISFDPRNNADASSVNLGSITFQKTVAADTGTIDIANTAGRVFLEENGDVGINDNAPNFKLDVAGDVRIQSANNLRFAGTGAGDSEINIFRNAANELTINATVKTILGGDLDLGSNDLLNGGTLNATIGAITTVNATNVNSTNSNITNMTGTLVTASQPNVTSLGILTGLNVAGNIAITGVGNGMTIASGNVGITLGDITLTSGNFNTIAGSVDTQTVNADNIVVGVQLNLDSNNIVNIATASGTTASFTTVSATNLGGTLTTAAQGNVTSLGTLTSLNVSGITDTDSISFVDDPASTEMKMISTTITNWNMDTTTVKVVSLSIPSSATLLQVFGIIEDDTNAQNYTIPLTDPTSASWEVSIERITRNATDVTVRMQRRATGLFDSTDFDSTGDRGSVIAIYTD